MTTTEKNTVVEVRPGPIFPMRRTCAICRGTTEKDVLTGVFHLDNGRECAVCEACCGFPEVGQRLIVRPRDIPARLRESAEALEAEAAALREYATREWRTPSEVEWEAAMDADPRLSPGS